MLIRKQWEQSKFIQKDRKKFKRTDINEIYTNALFDKNYNKECLKNYIFDNAEDSDTDV